MAGPYWVDMGKMMIRRKGDGWGGKGRVVRLGKRERQ